MSFLLHDRVPGKSFHRFVENMEEVAEFVQSVLPPEDWVVERHDFAGLPFVEQIRQASKARISLGAHGDGLAWGIFMRPESVLMEMVPLRRGGYQVCEDGMNKNRRGIFGGLIRFAKNVTHVCWTNFRGRSTAFNTSSDVYDWHWRMMNIRVDMVKLAHWLRSALWVVYKGLPPALFQSVEDRLREHYAKKGIPVPEPGEEPSDSADVGAATIL